MNGQIWGTIWGKSGKIDFKKAFLVNMEMLKNLLKISSAWLLQCKLAEFGTKFNISSVSPIFYLQILQIQNVLQTGLQMLF